MILTPTPTDTTKGPFGLEDVTSNVSSCLEEDIIFPRIGPNLTVRNDRYFRGVSHRFGPQHASNSFVVPGVVPIPDISNNHLNYRGKS